MAFDFPKERKSDAKEEIKRGLIFHLKSFAPPIKRAQVSRVIYTFIMTAKI